MAKNKAEKNKALILGTADESSSAPVVKAKKAKAPKKEYPPDYVPRDPKTGKARPYGGTGEGNPKHAHIPQEERCARVKKNDERCQRLPMKGTTLCYVHGGIAPQIAQSAIAYAQNQSERLMRGLVEIAFDEEEATPNRIAASRDVLDRGGVRAASKLDITHEMKPWERAEQAMLEGGRRRAEDPAYAAAQDRAREAYHETLQAEMNDDRY